MATYTIPPNAGPFNVVTSMAGMPLVTDGRRRNGVHIACKTRAQARELCDKLNRKDHNGTITVGRP